MDKYGTLVRVSGKSHEILKAIKEEQGSTITFLLNNMIWLVWGKKYVEIRKRINRSRSKA